MFSQYEILKRLQKGHTKKRINKICKKKKTQLPDTRLFCKEASILNRHTQLIWNGNF